MSGSLIIPVGDPDRVYFPTLPDPRGRTDDDEQDEEAERADNNQPCVGGGPATILEDVCGMQGREVVLAVW